MKKDKNVSLPNLLQHLLCAEILSEWKIEFILQALRMLHNIEGAKIFLKGATSRPFEVTGFTSLQLKYWEINEATPKCQIDF